MTEPAPTDSGFVSSVSEALHGEAPDLLGAPARAVPDGAAVGLESGAPPAPPLLATRSLGEKARALDTFVRALEAVAALAPEVTALEAAVAEREAEVLRQVLALMSPVVDRLAAPLILKEPWADKPGGEPKRLREPGIVLTHGFQHPVKGGLHVHTSHRVILLSRGRLLEVHETARWTEPARSDISWTVETEEAAITPAFAAKNLRPLLAAILDVLRRALVREVESRRDLQDRLDRLLEADRALGR